MIQRTSLLLSGANRRAVERCVVTAAVSVSQTPPQRRPFRKASLVVFVVAFLGWSASACGPDGPPSETVYVFENSPLVDESFRSTTAAQLDEVAALAASEDGRLVVFQFGDGPTHMRRVLDRTLAGEGNNDVTRADSRNALLAQIKPELQSIAQAMTESPAPDVDVFGSLYQAAEALQSSPAAPRRLVVHSYFSHRTGWADVAAYLAQTAHHDLDDDAVDQILTWVAQRGVLPDLSGVDVVLNGFGTGGDGAVSTGRALAYQRLFQQWCNRAHARSCTATTDLQLPTTNKANR